MLTDADRDYADYLQRFARLVGDHQVGQYGRFRNRLVMKLTPREFSEKVNQSITLADRFNTTLEAGDTIDDTLALEIRALEVELVLESSRFLPDGLFGR